MEHSSLNNNKLLELSSQIFALSALFRGGDQGKSLDPSFQQTILSEFDSFQMRAIEAKIDVTTIQHAKYALAAFMDEVVLNSNWPGHNDWLSHTLQLNFFGDHSAGEGFFSRLTQLRQSPSCDPDLLEVYYVCLQLGFEGVYRMQGLDKLLTLQVDLYSHIDHLRGKTDSRLAPDVLPEQNIVTKASREVPFWAIGSVTLALIFFIYLGFSLVINHEADKALTTIKASIQSIKTSPPVQLTKKTKGNAHA